MSEPLSGSYAESINGKPLGCDCLAIAPRVWLINYNAIEPPTEYEWKLFEFSLSIEEEIGGRVLWVGYYDRDFWWFDITTDTDRIVTVRTKFTVDCNALGFPADHIAGGWYQYYDPPAPWGVGYIYSPDWYRFNCPLSPPLIFPITHPDIHDGEIIW